MANQAETLLNAVREFAPKISARSAEIETARRLPADLLSELVSMGIFRMLTPKSHGGMEIDFPTTMEIVETIAEADGASGWTVMIGCETPQLFALLPRPRFDQIYAKSPDVIAGGGFAPRGTADFRGDEYLVNGRWAFASGCQHADWLIGNCMVTESGKPRPGIFPGSPEGRAMLFAPRDVRILDTWKVNGLRGTGSHDIEVDESSRAKGRQPRHLSRPILDSGTALLRAPRVLCFAYSGSWNRHRKARFARNRRARCNQQEASLHGGLDG